MAIIKRMRLLKDAGVLADRTARDAGPVFLSYNLIYGFNGSGKSTLSRLFACLQAGKTHEEVPEGCSFEIEMDDGTVYGSPGNLSGIESRVCVFNTDFVDRNLRWKEGRATSVFYISEAQSDLAAELEAKKEMLEVRKVEAIAQGSVVAANSRALGTHKTERARTISGKLHLGNRRYEAPQLQADYDTLPFDDTCLLTDDALTDFEEVARQAAPPPPHEMLQDQARAVEELIASTRTLAELSISQTVLDEIERHPSMVPWLNTGHEYHAAHGLESCLYCGNRISEERKAKLDAAFDDKLSTLIESLSAARQSLAAAVADLPAVGRPAVNEIEGSLRTPYNNACKEFEAAQGEVDAILRQAVGIVDERTARPTLTVDHRLPAADEVRAKCETLQAKVAVLNELLTKHNEAAADFQNSQSAARDAIKKHFLAQGHGDYRELKAAVDDARSAADGINGEVRDLEAEIADLSAKVRTHGPAAEKITKLVHSYLGHPELTIFPAEEGYELHRHGRLVKGPPSEGEKTALALCYFLSTLEADGRDIKNQIIVIDDPISSLDTKALNYASALIRACVENAAQVFVMTHNQHCMNEFKKAWQRRAEAKPDKPATAALLYVDVTMPEGSGRRQATLVEMPKHLRGYDSEYHFLCAKALQFEAAGEGYSEYWFMMPNVIRRVLEVFLGFKEPGSHSVQQKLEAQARKLPDLDPIRVKALDRLVNVESHSDNLDDLIAHSSMTIEETKDANTALLALMTASDAGHMAAIRSQCSAA